MKELKIKDEFKTLIEPLSEDEFQTLEKECVENGILDTIKISNGFIIDGHNRYKIAKIHNLKFETLEMPFESDLHIIQWMLRTQLGRRNLTEIQRTNLIGLRHENEKKLVGAPSGNDNAEKNNGINVIPLNPNRVRQKIADEVGVSPATVQRSVEFTKGLKRVSPELKQEILSNKVKVSKTDIRELRKSPPEFKAETIKEVKQKLNEMKGVTIPEVEVGNAHYYEKYEKVNNEVIKALCEVSRDTFNHNRKEGFRAYMHLKIEQEMKRLNINL